MTTDVVALIGGLLFIALGIFGGITAEKLTVPTLPNVARIAACALGVLLCVPFMFGSYRAISGGDTATSTTTPAPTTTSAPASSPTPSPGPAQSSPPSSTTSDSAVVLDSPREGEEFAGASGVTISGSVGNIGSDDLWAFDIAEGPTGAPVYFLVTKLNLINKRFGIVDKPIGDGDKDVGSLFAVTVVRASPDCSATIRQKSPNADGTTTFDTLPDGCTEAATRTIKKTAP